MLAAQPFSFTSLAADIEKEMGFACIRAFMQLVAIGYVIQLILSADHPAYVVLMVAAMLAFAAATSPAPTCCRRCACRSRRVYAAGGSVADRDNRVVARPRAHHEHVEGVASGIRGAGYRPRPEGARCPSASRPPQR